MKEEEGVALDPSPRTGLGEEMAEGKSGRSFLLSSKLVNTSLQITEELHQYLLADLQDLQHTLCLLVD
jgi:hypothetical protein